MSFIFSFILGGLLPTFVVKTLFVRLLGKLSFNRPENLPANLPGRERVVALLKKAGDSKAHIIVAHILSLLVCTIVFGLIRHGWYAPLEAFGLVLVPQSLWLALDLFQLKKNQAAGGK